MQSRREFALGCCGGFTTLFAGCLGRSDSEDSADDTGTPSSNNSETGQSAGSETPDAGETDSNSSQPVDFGAYTDWIPASVLPNETDQRPAITLFKPSRIVEIDDIESTGTAGRFLPGIENSDIDLTVGFLLEGEQQQETLRVATGSFGSDTVLAGYEQQQSVERTGTHREFDLYSVGSERVVATSDNIAVTAVDRATLESSIDARHGSDPRLVDQNDDFAAMTAELGTPDRGILGPSASEFGSTAFGNGYSLSEGVSDVHFVLVYDDTESAQSRLEEVRNGITGGLVSNTDVTVEGRLIHVRGIQETRNIFSYSSRDPEPPSTTLNTEYQESAGVVRVTSTEGSADVPAEQLALYGSGFDDAYRTTLAEMPESGYDQGDSFGEGESFEVPVEDQSYRLIFLWESADGSTAEILLVVEPDD
jgi:hypothetical protein